MLMAVWRPRCVPKGYRLVLIVAKRKLFVGCNLVNKQKYFYRPQTKFGQGNMFTGVCLSTGGCLLPGGLPGGDPLRTATAAGGTHPTGMHSCCSCQCLFLDKLIAAYYSHKYNETF